MRDRWYQFLFEVKPGGELALCFKDDSGDEIDKMQANDPRYASFDRVVVHGGYGYCSDYPVEQFMRDCKIASLYEGTNGIQAMDLISRKLGMKGGAVFLEFITYMDEVINTAKQKTELSSKGPPWP